MTLQLINPAPPASLAQVAEAERTLGFRLPPEYTEWLTSVANGSRVELATIDDRGMMALTAVYGVGRTDRLNLTGHRQVFDYLFDSGMLPIGDSEGGNQVCLSLRPDDYGSVWFANHEFEPGIDPEALLWFAKDWADFAARAEQPSYVTDPPELTGEARVWVDPEFARMLIEGKFE